MPIRVLLVEDFEPFRQVIRTILQEAGLQVVAEASDGWEAVRQADELRPNLVLMDIGLPTLNGIAAARRIRELVPDSTILFVSQESSPDVIDEALSLGAAGYVVKAFASTDLVAALHAVREGRKFVSTCQAVRQL